MKTFKLTLDESQYTRLRSVLGFLSDMGLDRPLIADLNTQFEEVDPDMDYNAKIQALSAKIDAIAEELQEHTREYNHDKFVDEDHEHPSEEEMMDDKIGETMEEVGLMINKAIQAHTADIEQCVVATIENMDFHQLVVDSIKKLVNG